MSRRAAWLDEPAPERRFGIKGPRAAQALAEAGLAVPDAANSWAPLRASDRADSWNVVSRLGHSEFFVEESGDASGIAALEALLARGFAGAWPVLREDWAVVLGGMAAREALAEVCNVDFTSLRGARPVVLASMIGVGVLVLPQLSAIDGPIYRIWCDPTYGAYLRAELEAVVTRIEKGRTR